MHERVLLVTNVVLDCLMGRAQFIAVIYLGKIKHQCNIYCREAKYYLSCEQLC